MMMMSKPARAIYGNSSPPNSVFNSAQLFDVISRDARLTNMWPGVGSFDKMWGSVDSVDEEDITHCCLPTGCLRYLDEPISVSDPSGSVKVVCSNEDCHEGQWMHVDCFHNWENNVLNFLRSCGRARSWSEVQRQENLWTKKGYDIVFKACECRCGRGFLRCDTAYISSKSDDERQPNKSDVVRARLSSVGNISQYSMGLSGRAPLRVQRSWSPPSSTGTTPVTPPGQYMPSPTSSGTSSSASSSRKNSNQFQFDFQFPGDSEQATTGNIFRHRTDLMSFNVLPHRLQNTYQVRMEDEGPHGNDETRCRLLTSLSIMKATTVRCVVCCSQLPVYDKYPLVDGTFFLSPVRYAATADEIRLSPSVNSRHGPLYLNAICMRCVGACGGGAGCSLTCRVCRTPWSGSSLMIGTMYSYDIFAAMPCCAARLACNRCRQPLSDPASAFRYFSDYSRLLKCPHCAADDYHFVKPLEDIYVVSRRSSP